MIFSFMLLLFMFFLSVIVFHLPLKQLPEHQPSVSVAFISGVPLSRPVFKVFKFKSILIHNGCKKVNSHYLGLSFNDSERHTGGGPLVSRR